MYMKLSNKIILTIVVVATAAILTVPPFVLQLSYAQTNEDLEKNILDVHNRERTAVGVEPLTWSNSIAAGAQTWAQNIATTGKFVHDPVHTGLTCKGPCYGENIAGFFNGVSEPNGGQSLWVAEKSQYHGGPSFYAVGHYTQMVWQNSREIGCGTAPPGAGGLAYSILVCRYSPPGNYPNQLPYPQK
jgi:pathogenesis-related protein 1